MASSPRTIDVVRAELAAAKSNLKIAGSADERDEIQHEIDGLNEEIRDLKESQAEDARDAREDAKARLAGLWEAMGPNGYFSDFIKRPTQAQVKACVAELDAKGRWDEETASALLDLLLLRFPELEKKSKQTTERKPTKKQPAGCAGILIAGLFIGGFGVYFFTL